MPVAIASTIGVVVDRYLTPPALVEIVLAIGGIVAWFTAFSRRSKSASFWLCLTAAGMGDFYHHDHCSNFDTHDIGTFATETPTPIRLRGMLEEEPTTRPANDSPLLSYKREKSSGTVLEVNSIYTTEGWQPASGRVRLTVDGSMDGLHLGDTIQLSGKIALPNIASNPGEWDTRSRLLDQRITAEMRSGNADGAVRLDEGWRSSILGWLAVIRGWGTRTLMESLPKDEAGVAAALLLGDGSVMDRGEWDVYIRTGVVHVLAISGQHLVVLAGFLWMVLRVLGIRRRRGAWFIAILIVGYAVLTGGRPSAVRAAVMVCVICGGIVLRRPVMAANAFAFAWLIVLALNPADLFNAGCQLSFLSVFVLIWFAAPLLMRNERDPVQQLIDESRTIPEKALRAIGRIVWIAYAVSFILGVANAPLILYWQNLVSPAGIVLGPPLLMLTSIALIAGFLLLLIRPLGMWAIFPLAWIVALSLALCGWLVHLADGLPWAAVYAPAPSMLWLAGFYVLLAASILIDGQWRRRVVIGLAVWTLGGLLLGAMPSRTDEMRATFLAVGHGGCTVIETPDGRVLLYDAGTTFGPEVVRRVIAPYLWSRGIGRIDEVFLSHADLDHFNGVPELLRRFKVGRITHTPSFPDKDTKGVAVVLEAIDRHGVERRTATLGDRFTSGEVTIDVLHPPVDGSSEYANENARSLVLLVSHAGHSLLLTGDLEKAGLSALREQKPTSVDVMLAPHHGSKDANVPDLAAWAQPRLVISCQEPKPVVGLLAVYGPRGGQVLDTATAGAITVRSHKSGLIAETFRTQERIVVRRGAGR